MSLHYLFNISVVSVDFRTKRVLIFEFDFDIALKICPNVARLMVTTSAAQELDAQY